MAEQAAPVAPAPVAPQPAAAPAQAPNQPPKRRLSEMEFGLEQANTRSEQRAIEAERRLARQPREEPQEPLEQQPGLLAEGEDPEEPGLAAEEALDQQDPNAPQLEAADAQLLEQVKEWRETGELPEEMLKLPISWVDKNGNLVEETIGGLQERGMRLSDYHREMGRLKQRDQQHDAVVGNINKFFGDIKTPERFLEEFEDRGYDDTIRQVAIMYAQREAGDKRIAEAAGIRVMQQYGCDGRDARVVDAMKTTMERLRASRKVEAQNRKLQKENVMRNSMVQQQQTQAEAQQRMQQLGNSLSQLIPVAFKATRVRNNPANVQAFYRHLLAYTDTLPNWDGNYRRVHCLKAAQMLAEEIQDADAARRPVPQAKPKAKALPPGRMAAAGSAQPAGAQKKRLSEMANDPNFGFGLG